LKYSENRRGDAINHREGKRLGMNYEEFKRLYEVSDADYENVRKIGVRIAPAINDFVESLYAYMREALGYEFEIHFPDEASLARAQSLSRRAWLEEKGHEAEVDV